MPPHLELPRDLTDTYIGGGSKQRRDGYECGVFLTRVDISGIHTGGVPGKGTKPGKTQRVIHVHTLKVQNLDSTGGINANPVVQQMWYAHAGGLVVATQTYGQL